jgi:NADPH:quinone reductase-like Zn-dependent oxidoreductase
MKALVLERPGSFDDLRLADIPQPTPGPGEIRLRVRAVGLNPVDYKLLGGHPAWTYPFVPGLDVAGVVDALGPGVDQEHWSPGDEVFYHGDLRRPGGLAEYAIAPAHILSRVPENESPVESAIDMAALPCAGITAYMAIHRKLHLQAGRAILIQAGAGGVGGFAIQLAALVGATVITTCSASNFDYVRQLGADAAIDYRSEDVRARVMQITQGRGVDAVIDTLGRQSATEALTMLAFGGQLVCIEALPNFADWHMFNKAISVHEIALGVAHAAGDHRDQAALAEMGEELAALVAEGRVNPMISEVIALETVPAALRRLAERHVRGKIVVQIAQG